jgi:hypothetical protein
MEILSDSLTPHYSVGLLLSIPLAIVRAARVRIFRHPGMVIGR